MNSKRVLFLMIGLVVLLAGAGAASVFFGNSMLSKQGKKLLELRLEDRVIEEQQAALIAANKEIDQYADLEKIAKTVVPQDKDQARTVREINKIAEESGIKLKSVTFPASNLGQAVATPTQAESENSTTPAQPPLTQVKPVEGIPGVYALEIVISPIDVQPVSYNKFIDFLERLEKNRRTAHVDKIAITPVGNAISFTLTLNAYVKPWR